MVNASGFLTESNQPPLSAPTANSPSEVLSHPLLEEDAWVALRDSGILPLVQSELVTTEQHRAEFLTGCWLLGLLDTIKPQMLRAVDVLAAGKLLNAVIMPRRSSKTTTIFCILLGRCYLRPVHYAGFTLATTAKKAAERYRLDIYGPITRSWPDPDNRPVKLYKGNGVERVEFLNGSLMAVLSPEGDAFRSGAYDTLLVDEAGEASPELGEDIQGAVLPAFDTRPDGQLIVAGTAARYRKGNLLWDTLNDAEAAVLRYTVADTVTDEELEDWEPSEEHPEASVRALIEQMHPGINTLTTLDRIAFNFRKLGREQFAREYLGLFGIVGESSGVFDLVKWAGAGSGAALPAPPERFGLAIVTHPDQLSASIVAAWRDPDGKAVPLLLEHKKGVDWLADAALRLSRKYNVPIIYDAGSQVVLLTVEQLNRARPRPRLQPMTFMPVKKGAALIVDEVALGRVEHYRQPELDNAIKLAVKRKAGANGWALGRAEANDDITAVEAWSLAQLAYDEGKPNRERRPSVVRT